VVEISLGRKGKIKKRLWYQRVFKKDKEDNNVSKKPTEWKEGADSTKDQLDKWFPHTLDQNNRHKRGDPMRLV
jgi:hypothetical protein